MKYPFFATIALLAGSTASAQIELEKVFDTSMLIPDGSGDTFVGIDEPPSLSNGTVLAAIELPPTPISFFVEGMFSIAPDGTIVEYFRTDDPFPDGNGTVFRNATHGYDISDGNVVFSPARNDRDMETIVTVFDGVFTTVVENGVTPIPGGNGDLFINLATSVPVPLSGQNFVFEDAGLFDEAGTSGIYAYIDGALVTIARAGEPSPDGSTFTDDFDEPDIDGTNIVFEASTGFSTNDLYAVFEGSSFPIITETVIIPGTTNSRFGFTNNPQIIGGSILFEGGPNNGDSGLYVAEVTSMGVESLARIVVEGDAVPDRPGMTFSNLFDSGIGDNGDLVVFKSEFDNGNEQGIFAFYQGTLMNVIDSTQTLEDKSIRRFDIEGEGVDGNQFAFEVSFTDGTDAIYIATIPVNACTADITATGLCDTLAGGDGVVNLSDFSCYLSQWSNANSIADITTTGVCDAGNGDGVVNLSDFSCYLAEWSQGCP